MPLSVKRIQRITILYWFLLCYIIAALVWWFISLEKQNSEMTALALQNLQSEKNEITTEDYRVMETEIYRSEKRNNAKYLGEGITFLTLTLIGAGFVSRSIRKQFRMQHQQQNFMMAVTHELKTPISVARLNLETLQKHHLEESKQRKLIAMTLQETSRLNFLTNNILIASQLEGGGYAFTRDDLNLSDLFRDCIQDFIQRFPDREFNSSIEADTEVKGDPLLLQLLINNLLENAIKYSPRQKTIQAILKRVAGKPVLQIIDEGEGIPDAEKKNIFDKFYRIGNEATRRAQGTGLGLYLCKKIAADHNADISVTNNTPSGSIFTVEFRVKK